MKSVLVSSNSNNSSIELNRGAVRRINPATTNSSDSWIHTSTAPSRNHDQTIAYAQTALEHITTLQLPADPPSFEVWYTYSSGHNPALSEAVNQILLHMNGLSMADLDRIHYEHLPSTGTAVRVEAVGTKVGEEVEQLVNMIDVAIGSTALYKEELADTKQSLDNVRDQQSLRHLIDRLASATTAIEKQNQQLRVSLTSKNGEIKNLQSTLNLIRADSLTDSLTGLANRKYFDRSFDQAVAQSAQDNKPLSLLLCDVDHFKQFNDKYGHTTGDDVLRLIASMMRRMVRREDIPARYGGEEFTIILRNTTLQHAAAIGENISKTLSQREVIKRSTGEKLGRITISIGAAELRSGETAQALIERADDNLYVAKRTGRNRVIWN